MNKHGWNFSPLCTVQKGKTHSSSAGFSPFSKGRREVVTWCICTKINVAKRYTSVSSLRYFLFVLKDAGGIEEKGEVLFCTFTSMWVCFEYYGHLFRRKCLLSIRWGWELAENNSFSTETVKHKNIRIGRLQKASQWPIRGSPFSLQYIYSICLNILTYNINILFDY